MSRHELASAEEFLFTTLSDATLLSYAPGGVHNDTAPDGTPTPYVVFGLQSPVVDSRTMNEVRLLTNPLYQVVATGEASKMDDIVNAASRIDDLLKRDSGDVTGGEISACYREQPVTKNELVNTQKWKSIGGLFRLEIQQST
jgi:hypothetical protein